MVLSGVSDFPLLEPPQVLPVRHRAAPDAILAAVGRDLQTAVLWEDRAAEDDLLALAAALGPRLLVPEVWRRVLPQAGVLIPAAISGGELSRRYAEAAGAAPRRCWLLLEETRMDFPLPCPTGCGLELGESRLAALRQTHPAFDAPSLGCRYLHYVENGQGHMVLFDTAETLAEKRNLAKQCGFLGAVRL